MSRGDLRITLRQWTDATRTPSTQHPEVVISGDAAALHRLKAAIDFALAAPGVHTHIASGDPGVATSPAGLMLTIDHLDTRPANGSAIHSPP